MLRTRRGPLIAPSPTPGHAPIWEGSWPAGDWDVGLLWRRCISTPARPVEFVSDATQNLIADKISASFVEAFRYEAPKSEVASWRNSLRAMADAVQLAELDDHGVVVEWQLAACITPARRSHLGYTPEGRSNAVIVELKQWEESADDMPTTAC